MAMEWTEETIARLRDLWQQGLSTAEIGRQLSVTKNAVVGKAHRLGLKPRPSPIRRAAKVTPPADAATQAAPVAAAPAVAPKKEAAPAPVVAAPSVPEKAPAPVKASVAVPAPKAATPAAAEPAPEAAARPARAPARAARAALRPVSEPRRRSSQSCCWPLGDPGTPGFHFCGATPLPGKPYCAEHAQLAYVKLRSDRRDSVA
ncbi:GcrA cell cycle regulator [Komagataeibacter xylinus]|uniref:GcrA cell cycle regulator n=3 Tax=Komagataeibacter xylinus TaxID=28448 RepID=A0A318PIS0_KOMXY|nr:GcrA family cell cycle regulator [Komagataeibacter xylinus]AZV38823.1 GcrA cell cycle regulator [Komagataeibacter xylinus]PYD56068.1 GcrA cell cycle regulator [Komagataeibacter xylinus]